jgi:hypothetical protein
MTFTPNGSNPSESTSGSNPVDYRVYLQQNPLYQSTYPLAASISDAGNTPPLVKE